MTPPPRTRVLVVDDSAFARKVLRETLSSSPGLEVVGIARDGLEALEKIAELRPDVVTLDLVMPNLDGLGVLRALSAHADAGTPRFVIVSISDSNSALGVEALQMGAVDLVQKPTALATDRLYELSGELIAKVTAAGQARAHTPVPVRPPSAPPVAAGVVQLIVLGTSTGGPQALTRLLPALPRDLPCPVAVALHIPPGYTATLAQRLNDACALEVSEAVDNAPLGPGRVVIAPGGMNLRIRRDGRRLTTHLDSLATASPYCPSVDVLFQSAADSVGAATLGVVLTGMGDDGVQGARAIRRSGGRVLTEAEASCVVYGMPRAVVEAEASDGEALLEDMAERMVTSL
jgi:two-component system, chemotaxis family, protein-glutamate methylesterase/glutaminase